MTPTGWLVWLVITLPQAPAEEPLVTEAETSAAPEGWKVTDFMPHQPPPLPRGEPIGQPECVRQIDLGDFGAWVARYGDLDGDGEADVLFVQTKGQQITCLTALNLRGEQLWQVGTPHAERFKISSDAAVQIYDQDGDGQNEVLYVDGLTLRLLDGRTGRVEREGEVAANDCLLIANFSGGERPQDLVVKDRYKHLWVYDADFRLRWEAATNTGHYPLNLDFDGDGRDELLCGYTLFDDDGTVLWEHPELPVHNDAVDADDMDGDGVPEIAIACSRDSVLLTAQGEILWRQPHRHSQHAVIGAFVPDRPGKQVVFVDRGQGGVVFCYTKEGTELWHTRPQGWLTIVSTVEGWTGEECSYLLLFRRSVGPPVLVNGRGEQVAEFPFPPAQKENGWDQQYYVQHFDAFGDAREEIFVHNERALWVYTNAAPEPDLPVPTRREPEVRLYNATFYIGRP
ncbi:MAG TPA: hypothetical protein EYP85_06720 [Armatimonadetes bacterium]|nr:hypothetical protein [Armatimonadota bacterium]